MKTNMLQMLFVCHMVALITEITSCSVSVSTETELNNAISSLSCYKIELSANIHLTDSVMMYDITTPISFHGNNYIVFGSASSVTSSFYILNCNITFYNMSFTQGGKGGLN
jgi:hypothetical protein